MTSQRFRVWSLAAAVLVAGAVGWFAWGAPAESPEESTGSEGSDGAAPSEAPPILRNDGREPAAADHPPEAAPVANDDGPRPAPGAAPWARGQDLPPPALPDEPPQMDPEHMRYREAAANVGPADQVAYLERSMVLLDTSIEALEARHAEDPESARGRRLAIRIERLRLSRRERQVELGTMRERAAAESGEEPSEEASSDAPTP